MTGCSGSALGGTAPVIWSRLDSFYIGNLKGVGKVYQLTAIDIFTRWAFILIVLGTRTDHAHCPLLRPRHRPLPTPRCHRASGADRQWTRI